MLTKDDLKRILSRINGKGYRAYKDIKGEYKFDFFQLAVDHVQGDPFASPSKIRIRVHQDKANIPLELFVNSIRRMALEDFLAREIHSVIHQNENGRRGSGKSGLILLDSGGQEVLERTALVLTKDWVEARLSVGLPARGRTILGRVAVELLCKNIPDIAKRGLIWKNLPQGKARQFVECIENFEHIRAQLDSLDIIAFVADGSILPRESGASNLPLLKNETIAFRSPESLHLKIQVPNPIQTPLGQTDRIPGMGIPKGVTLIVGGGYHGKSTLLKALEQGIYPHIPGDGREYVVTSRDAVKIRSEDGRRVELVDISPFISQLPYGRKTSAFSTDDASGSTSQAANIVEALEVGALVLLLDEDTSATNFMVRDARMQALVTKENEPITPFLERVRELYKNLGVSTILVMGGCGDYFDVADTIIMMKDYIPIDMTVQGKEIARSFPTNRETETKQPLNKIIKRIPQSHSFDPSRGKRKVKIDAKGKDKILYGRDPIDLRFVEQLVDISQIRAVGMAIHLVAKRLMDNKTNLSEMLNSLEDFLDEKGLDQLDPYYKTDRHPGDFARPRKYEIASAINRLRTVKMKQDRNSEI